MPPVALAAAFAAVALIASVSAVPPLLLALAVIALVRAAVFRPTVHTRTAARVASARARTNGRSRA